VTRRIERIDPGPPTVVVSWREGALLVSAAVLPTLGDGRWGYLLLQVSAVDADTELPVEGAQLLRLPLEIQAQLYAWLDGERVKGVTVGR
jgi:hypothetical protein